MNKFAVIFREKDSKKLVRLSNLSYSKAEQLAKRHRCSIYMMTHGVSCVKVTL